MNYCTQCGRQLFDNSQLCQDCAVLRQKKAIPYAEPAPTQDFSQYQTRPLDQPPDTRQMQPFAQAHLNQQTPSQCRLCGGSAGVFTRSNISQAGIIYMVVMFIFSFITLMIFFPCAVIPLGLLFLGLLMKEKHLACLNCGQKVN